MLESLTGRGGRFLHTALCHGEARGCPRAGGLAGQGRVCPQGHLLKLKKERQGCGKA